MVQRAALKRWLKAASVLVLQSLEDCGAGAGSRGDDAPCGYRTAASGLGHLELGFRRGLRAGLPAPTPLPATRRMQGWRGQLPESPPGDEAGPPQEGRGTGAPQTAGSLAPVGLPGPCLYTQAWEQPGDARGLVGACLGHCGVGVELGGFMGQGAEKSLLAHPQITPWRAGGHVGMDAPLPWVPCQPTLG